MANFAIQLLGKDLATINHDATEFNDQYVLLTNQTEAGLDRSVKAIKVSELLAYIIKDHGDLLSKIVGNTTLTNERTLYTLYVKDEIPTYEEGHYVLVDSEYISAVNFTEGDTYTLETDTVKDRIYINRTDLNDRTIYTSYVKDEEPIYDEGHYILGEDGKYVSAKDAAEGDTYHIVESTIKDNLYTNTMYEDEYIQDVTSTYEEGHYILDKDGEYVSAVGADTSKYPVTYSLIEEHNVKAEIETLVKRISDLEKKLEQSKE